MLLLTIEQACARLQIGRTTLWRAGRDGLIRFTPIGRGGRGKRVHIDDLEAYARRLREGAA